MGTLQVQGSAFVGEFCQGRRSIRGDGLFEVMQFYTDNRASRRLRHVSIAIGKTVISGFLLGMQAQSENQKRFFNWTLTFAAIPNFESFGRGQGTTFPGASSPQSVTATPAPATTGEQPRQDSNITRL